MPGGDHAQALQSRLLQVPSSGFGGDAANAGPYACLRTGPEPGGTQGRQASEGTSPCRPDTSGPVQR
jgi:hypothetical protein